jgi:hypothetical protein
VAHCYICVECVAVCNIEEPTTPDGGSLLVLIGDAIVTYDANGNLKKDPAYAYTFDEENRLTKVTRNSDSAVVGQYQHDALSRRVQKIANPAATPATTLYFHDGARTIEEQNTRFQRTDGVASQRTHASRRAAEERITATLTAFLPSGPDDRPPLSPMRASIFAT